MKTSSRHFFGIDLGTSSCSIAYVADDPRQRDAQIVTVQTVDVAVEADGAHLITNRIPSVVAAPLDPKARGGALFGLDFFAAFAQEEEGSRPAAPGPRLLLVREVGPRHAARVHALARAGLPHAVRGHRRHPRAPARARPRRQPRPRSAQGAGGDHGARLLQRPGPHGDARRRGQGGVRPRARAPAGRAGGRPPRPAEQPRGRGRPRRAAPQPPRLRLRRRHLRRRAAPRPLRSRDRHRAPRREPGHLQLPPPRRRRRRRAGHGARRLAADLHAGAAVEP